MYAYETERWCIRLWTTAGGCRTFRVVYPSWCKYNICIFVGPSLPFRGISMLLTPLHGPALPQACTRRTQCTRLCQGLERSPFIAFIWRIWALLKCKIFMWLAAQHPLDLDLRSPRPPWSARSDLVLLHFPIRGG